MRKESRDSYTLLSRTKCSLLHAILNPPVWSREGGIENEVKVYTWVLRGASRSHLHFLHLRFLSCAHCPPFNRLRKRAKSGQYRLEIVVILHFPFKPVLAFDSLIQNICTVRICHRQEDPFEWFLNLTRTLPTMSTFALTDAGSPKRPPRASAYLAPQHRRASDEHFAQVCHGFYW
jgi:hypothetical protein